MKREDQSMGPQGASMASADDDRQDGPVGTAQPSDGERAVRSAIAEGRHREALQLCARQHAEAIGRLCLALSGSHAEADDLTQETLLAAHDGFSSYRGEGPLRAWLLAIARRKCARHVERRVLRESKLRLVQPAEAQPATDDVLVRRQRAQQARAALEHVRPSEREALVLRYVSELSYPELAEACGIDEVAARKRVSRALATLRSVLAGQE